MSNYCIYFLILEINKVKVIFGVDVYILGININFDN